LDGALGMKSLPLDSGCSWLLFAWKEVYHSVGSPDISRRNSVPLRKNDILKDFLSVGKDMECAPLGLYFLLSIAVALNNLSIGSLAGLLCIFIFISRMNTN
jgi:hypothetical protein